MGRDAEEEGGERDGEEKGEGGGSQRQRQR